RNRVDLAAVNRGRVEQRRVAEPVEAIRIRADALVEDTAAPADRCFPVPEDIIGEAQPRTVVVPAMPYATLRNALTLFDHAIGQVARSRHDTASIGAVC